MAVFASHLCGSPTLRIQIIVLTKPHALLLDVPQRGDTTLAAGNQGLEKLWVSDAQLDKLYCVALCHNSAVESKRRRPLVSQLSAYAVLLLLDVSAARVTSWVRNADEPDAPYLTWGQVTIRLAGYTANDDPDFVVFGTTHGTKQSVVARKVQMVPFTIGSRSDGRLDKDLPLAFVALASLHGAMPDALERAIRDVEFGKTLLSEGRRGFFDFSAKATHASRPVFVVAGVLGPEVESDETWPMTQQAFRRFMLGASQSAGFAKNVGSAVLRRSQNMAVQRCGVVSEGDQAEAMGHDDVVLQRRVYKSSRSPENRVFARFGQTAGQSANVAAAVAAIGTVPQRGDSTVLSEEAREKLVELVVEYESAVERSDPEATATASRVAIEVLALAADGKDDGGSGLGWDAHPFRTQTDGSFVGTYDWLVQGGPDKCPGCTQRFATTSPTRPPPAAPTPTLKLHIGAWPSRAGRSARGAARSYTKTTSTRTRPPAPPQKHPLLSHSTTASRSSMPAPVG